MVTLITTTAGLSSRGELSQAVGDAVGDDALVRSLLDVTVQGGAHLHQGVRRLFLVGLDRQHERRVQVGVHGVHVRAELLERDDGEDVSGSRGEVERGHAVEGPLGWGSSNRWGSGSHAVKEPRSWGASDRSGSGNHVVSAAVEAWGSGDVMCA